MAEEIDRAQPLPRASLGVPGDALLLAMLRTDDQMREAGISGSAGRESSSRAASVATLAGRDDFGVVAFIERHFRARGAGDRGAISETASGRSAPAQDGRRLLRHVSMARRQSLLDAMYAGSPIVAMRAASDPDLDPNRCGPTSAYAEVMLERRHRVGRRRETSTTTSDSRSPIGGWLTACRAGRRAREKVRRVCSMERWAQTFGQAIAELRAYESASFLTGPRASTRAMTSARVDALAVPTRGLVPPRLRVVRSRVLRRSPARRSGARIRRIVGHVDLKRSRQTHAFGSDRRGYDGHAVLQRFHRLVFHAGAHADRSDGDARGVVQIANRRDESRSSTTSSPASCATESGGFFPVTSVRKPGSRARTCGTTSRQYQRNASTFGESSPPSHPATKTASFRAAGSAGPISIALNSGTMSSTGA